LNGLKWTSDDEVIAKKKFFFVPLKKEAFLLKMGLKPYKGKSKSKGFKGWT